MLDLQIKAEDHPGLWEITGMEVCSWAPPGHCTHSRCTKARPEVASARPPEDPRAGGSGDGDEPLSAHQEGSEARNSGPGMQKSLS